MGFAIALGALKALADSGHIGAQEAWLDIEFPGWDTPEGQV